MGVPIMRQYTRAAPAAINVFALATDDVTGLSVQQLNKDNSLVDFVNAVNPAGTAQYQTRLFINNLEAGPTFFSSNSNSGSAGRTIPGPLPISVQGNSGGKQLSYSTAQTILGGGVAAYQFIIKYANLF
jgi:hypothetical protein|tara:strand:+ start:97 stop:483 length:387 start_codon:yes stop_codon:yes gene_type:complete